MNFFCCIFDVIKVVGLLSALQSAASCYEAGWGGSAVDLGIYDTIFHMQQNGITCFSF